MNSRTWNVLAEGPSVYAATPADLLEGPVVAINDGIRLRHLRTPTFWAVIDPVAARPGNVWARNCHHLPQPLSVWFPARREKEWLKIQNGTDRLTKDTALDFSWITLEPHARNPEAKPGTWDEISERLSIFMTIRECAAHGASHVRLFGCDMKGKGNAVLGYDEKEGQSERDRWTRERDLMKTYVALAADKGITVERWEPAT